jgi:hypothetical protein
MEERQSYLWQDLNRRHTTKLRAGHAYEARRPESGGFWNRAGLPKSRLIGATLVGLPIVVVFVHIMVARW